MSGPFKMKGWSPFTQKTGKGPIMPKDHPVKPPTEEQMKKSKGELFERDLTGFRRRERVGTKKEQYEKRIKGMEKNEKKLHDFIYKISGQKKY